MTELLRIPLPQQAVASALRDLAPRVSTHSVRVPVKEVRLRGQWIRFEWVLADGTSVWEGIGKCERCVAAPADRPGIGGYDAVLTDLTFDPRNEAMFERILLLGEEEDRNTGAPAAPSSGESVDVDIEVTSVRPAEGDPSPAASTEARDLPAAARGSGSHSAGAPPSRAARSGGVPSGALPPRKSPPRRQRYTSRPPAAMARTASSKATGEPVNKVKASAKLNATIREVLRPKPRSMPPMPARSADREARDARPLDVPGERWVRANTVMRRLNLKAPSLAKGRWTEERVLQAALKMGLEALAALTEKEE